MKTRAHAAQSATTPLAPFVLDRREPGATDVALEILYCGVCHSDMHSARGEWPGIPFPHFRVGQLAAVGCMVDSCRVCANCAEYLEQYCDGPHGFTQTYNGSTKGGVPNTYGGYAAAIVVDEHFVLHIRHRTDQLATASPLLCAGITTWSPLKHWQAGPGKKVGIVGIGGLGHMGVKLAHALGAHVVAFTTSDAKREEARRLGADEVVVSRNANEMATHSGSLDFILNTGGAPRPGPVRESAAPGWHHDAGRCALKSASIPGRVQPAARSAQHRRIRDRRHSRNTGNAGFLRPERHRGGYRDDPDAQE